MNLVIVTGPAIEPITVAELKTHIRRDDSDGEPAPVELTAALGSVAGLLSNGVYSYRVTFVTADGETEGGLISSSVTVADNSVAGKISLSSIPLGGAAVTSRKVYRTEADGSTYKLVTTLSDNTTETYTDNIADAALGASVPTTNSTEDPYYTDCIQAAREFAEEYTRRALIDTTFDYKIHSFPSSGNIKLPRSALRSITHIKYTDNNGDEATWSSDEYSAFTGIEPGYVAPAYGEYYPTARSIDYAVTVRFVAGYGSARSNIPARIRQAIKILAGHFYENPDLLAFKAKPEIIPVGAMTIFENERVFEF